MKKTMLALLTVSLLVPGGVVMASQCVVCHTDSEKLKEIAGTLPKPVVSSETAGKG